MRGKREKKSWPRTANKQVHGEGKKQKEDPPGEAEKQGEDTPEETKRTEEDPEKDAAEKGEVFFPRSYLLLR